MHLVKKRILLIMSFVFLILFLLFLLWFPFISCVKTKNAEIDGFIGYYGAIFGLSVTGIFTCITLKRQARQHEEQMEQQQKEFSLQIERYENRRKEEEQERIKRARPRYVVVGNKIIPFFENGVPHSLRRVFVIDPAKMEKSSRYRDGLLVANSISFPNQGVTFGKSNASSLPDQICVFAITDYGERVMFYHHPFGDKYMYLSPKSVTSDSSMTSLDGWKPYLEGTSGLNPIIWEKRLELLLEVVYLETEVEVEIYGSKSIPDLFSRFFRLICDSNYRSRIETKSLKQSLDFLNDSVFNVYSFLNIDDGSIIDDVHWKADEIREMFDKTSKLIPALKAKIESMLDSKKIEDELKNNEFGKLVNRFKEVLSCVESPNYCLSDAQRNIIKGSVAYIFKEILTGEKSETNLLSMNSNLPQLQEQLITLLQ